MLASQKASTDTGLMPVGMTLLAFATMLAVRCRRVWQPALVLPTGTRHGSDMLLSASNDHTLELKSQTSTISGEAESRQRTQPINAQVRLDVGTYNLLCETYALKWDEREGVGPNGKSNWNVRWLAMANILLHADLDVVA